MDSTVRHQNHRQHQHTRQGGAASKHGTDAPRDIYLRDLASLRPDEVEKEGVAEDGRDVDAGEDVVGERADQVFFF